MFLVRLLCLLMILFFMTFPLFAELEAEIEEHTEAVLPSNISFVLATLGSGGIAGWSVGFTMKKLAKLAALALGISFVAIQVLAFNKFITIDWEKIKTAVPEKELENYTATFFSVVTYNLPFASSFVVGFWLGFKKG